MNSSESLFTPDMLDELTAFVGTSGSGKTYAAMGMVARLLTSHMRVAVVDPLGVWWGLRFAADGVTPAFPVVVLGGRFGDVVITSDMGAEVARLIATKDMSCVVDLSGLGGAGARRRFMTNFAETLYELNAQPLHLVLDEADLWTPQRPMPDQTVLLNRIDEIVRRGRVRGFIPWLISQRPAVIHKDVLSQATILIAMRLISPQDRAAIGGWIEGNADRQVGKTVLAELPQMETGEGYVWAPGRRIMQRYQFPSNATFDSSRTPRRGEVTATIEALPHIDLGTIIETLRQPPEAIAKAKEKPDAELVTLRAENATLREQIAALEAVKREHLAVLRAVLGYVAPYADASNGVGVIDVRRRPAPSTIDADLEPPARRLSAAAKPRPPAPADMVGAIIPAARSLFLTLAEQYPERRTWTQIATLAGRAPSGGQFNSGRKNLRDLGYIEEDGDLVCLSDAAIDYVRATRPDALSQPPKDLAALVQMWADKLPHMARNMLLEMTRCGPGFILPADLAARMKRQPSGGQWNAGVATLRANGLVEFQGKAMRLSNIFKQGST